MYSPAMTAETGEMKRPTEVWFRNPVAYIRECAEVLVPNIVWDRGLLRKRSIDPQRQLEMHYPAGFEYRLLLVGEQGTTELRRGSTSASPFAEYPTWEYGIQPLSLLEQILDSPPLGQEHRVVVINHPSYRTSVGRAFLRTLAEMQEDHPDAIIHVHGGYGMRSSLSFTRSGDIDPREDAMSGRIMLGSGRVIRADQAAAYADWVHLHHMTVGDLSVPRNRCIYNIRSCIWAGENFDASVPFRTRREESARARRKRTPKETPVKPYVRRMKVGEGDKFACNQCSLQMSCKLYRTGGVCTISDSEAAPLAAMFKTRDSDRIIEGLGKLLAVGVERAERGLADENLEGKLDPEVTKILNQTFLNGVKLAKLVDPSLAAASAPKVGVFINAGQQGMASRPNVLTAGAVAALEAQGIAREDITPEMIVAMMQDSAAIQAKRNSIEVTGS